MNVTRRQGLQRQARNAHALPNEQRPLEVRSLFGKAALLESAANAKGRKSGKGWRGLAGSSPRASDKNLNIILVESLIGGRFPAEGRPGDVHGGVR
jgi:hypothetical protein